MMPEPSLASRLASLVQGRRNDYVQMGTLTFGSLLTGLIPRRWDRWVLEHLLRTSLGVRPGCVRRTRARMEEVFSPLDVPVDLDGEARRFCARARETQWMGWRALTTEKSRARTRVEGVERIHEALEGGKGAILWGMSFGDNLVVKMGLYRAGIELIHLSRADHGVSLPATPLGLMILGPFNCLSENRFLAERVIIPADESLGYMRTLINRLEANGCVYIRGELASKRNNIHTRVLGRRVRYAPGAPGLAWKVGSPLLPVHVVRDGILQYRVIVHPPIRPETGADKTAFIQDAVDRFATLLEEQVLEHPSDWDQWRFKWPFWHEDETDS